MENKEIIKNAIHYIDKISNEKTSIEDIAEHAGFSTDYFNRVFRNHTGFNIMEYVRFRRLTKAAALLRKNINTDILSIAIGCGYESHEGFSRAFKEQYGVTPSEYRENMKNKPFIWADHQQNATAVAEFRHALPNFFEMDANDVITLLLEKDTKRYGYTAANIAFSGSKILSDNPNADDCFVIFDNFYEKPHFTLILKTLHDLRKYVELLSVFSPANFYFMFDSNVTLDAVKNELIGIRYHNLKKKSETIYLGDPFLMPEESKKYDIHILDGKDVNAVETFIHNHHKETFRKTAGYGLKTLLKKPLSDRPLTQPIGIFENNTLMAISYASPLSTHSFHLNDCIHIEKANNTPDEALRFLYLNATNEMIQKGYLPFEDAQFGEIAKSNGNFTAFDLGFEEVNTVFSFEL